LSWGKRYPRKISLLKELAKRISVVMILVSFVPYFNDRRLRGINPPNLENYIGFEESRLRGIGWVGGA
jgi:hypothetical protein